jgi:branched-chain amino acid transport system permease protein
LAAHRVTTALANFGPVATLAVPLAAATYAIAHTGGSIDRVVVNALINLVLVIGLYLFVGNSGVFSFGHMSFAAIGAYTSSLLTIPPDTKAALMTALPHFLQRANTGTITSLIAAGVVAAGVGAVLSWPLMRLNGFVATLATFSLLIIVNVVANNWQQVTNGTTGLSGIPTTTTHSSALVWAIVAIVVAFAFQQSRWGLRLRASREDDIAARASGIGVHAERRVAWILSAFFTGVGGGLYAQYIGSFSPDVFYFNATFLIIAMLVVGGLTSLAGAVTGTIVLSAISEVFRRVEGGISVGPVHIPSRPGLQSVVLGLIMLLILKLRPRGLTGGREIRLPSPSTVEELQAELS